MAPEQRTKRHVLVVSLCCFGAVLACLLLLPLIGPTDISYMRALAGVEPDRQILFDLRFTRVILGILAGGALSLAGLLFQALLRDALATPYTLGISSGASLGAVAAISLGWTAIWPPAIAAGLVTLAVVLAVASERRRLSPFTLLMSGITINSICTAGILFLHSVATFGQSIAITRWLMGGIEAIPYLPLACIGGVTLVAAVYTFSEGRHWNVLAVGEEWAAARGVPTGRLVLTGYLIGSLLTGLITSFTGPIGFVGLIVPHALRLSLGADHRVLIPASFLLGGAFLALCDTIAQIALAPAEVPVGVITALLGGPFFIYILRRR